MPGRAPSANSRLPRPPSPRRWRSAPTRTGAGCLALFLALSCSHEAPDHRNARRSITRYVARLKAHDVSALRASSTDTVMVSAVRGALLLRMEPIRTITLRTLDSMTIATVSAESVAAAACALAVEWDADSLEHYREEATRLARAVRAARAAAVRSARGAALPPETPLRLGRAEVRIRWGGPLVGPVTIDRIYVLRMLAVPGGPWIVFSLVPKDALAPLRAI